MKALFLGLFVGFVLLIPPVQAQEPVEILVDLLEADQEKGKIEPSLFYVRERIQRTPFRFRNFRLLDSQAMVIHPRQSQKALFTSPIPLEITVSHEGRRAGAVLLGLTIRSRQTLLLESEISLTGQQAVMIGIPDQKRTLLLTISQGL